MPTTVAPYGSWSSPVTPELLTQGSVRLSDLMVADGDVWWVEARPDEAGRQVVVRAGPGADHCLSGGSAARAGGPGHCLSGGSAARGGPGGGRVDMVPEGFSARTAVHEYGGAPFVTTGGALVFSNFSDQRLWRVDAGASPRPLTPEPPTPRAWRYADMRLVPGGAWMVAVRERHHGSRASEVENDLAAVPTDGGQPVALAGGHDFFAAPRPSPDGTRLAWIAWDHPNMPWDGTELWVADVVFDAGGTPALSGHQLVAGGPEESVSQPRWSPDGRLHWISDRTGWWNLYAEDGDAAGPRAAGGRDARALAPRPAEFGGPDWVFGQSTYAFLPDGRLVAAWTDDGAGQLGVLEPTTGHLAPLPTPYTHFTAVAAWGDGVVALAASPTEAAAVVAIRLDGGTRVLRRSRETPVEPELVSRPHAVRFPTTGGRTAFAWWYPPTNPGFTGAPDERPPLVVMSHGGPTGSASPALNLGVQFWTSRGVAVVDVDYGGSSGHGRAYRRALDGAWGIVDVDDCVRAALHLAERGEVDPERLVIRGGSAGGYTTLCALTFRDVFAAGASLYGVADLESLAADTHKFESRYLDRLVGPLPEARDRYRERSPLYHADRLSCPVILFQGTEDKVVPPAQAEVMVAALRAKGLPFAYVTFPGEQHGFRQADTIRRVAEAELSFYGQVLGFRPAGAIAPVRVENLTVEDGEG